MAGQADTTFWAEVLDEVEGIAKVADNATELVTAEFNRLNQQNRELQQIVQGSERYSEGPQSQRSEVARLEDENKRLRGDIEECKRHLASQGKFVINMLPGINSFASNSAGRGFREWLGNVQMWTDKYIFPVLEDQAQLSEALATESAEPERGSILRNALDKDLGLRLAAQIVHSEYEVVRACLLRWLTAAIFNEGYSDGFLSIKAMDESVEAMKQDKTFTPNALAQWKLQSYYALTNTSSYKDNRVTYIDKTTAAFAKGIGMFSLKRHDSNEFVSSIQHQIIEPGLALQEQLKISESDFRVSFFDVSPSAADQGKQNPQLQSIELDLEWEEYLDSTNNLAILPDTFDTHGAVLPELLGAVTPHLSYRSVSQGGRWQAPMVIAKQRRLVAWKDTYDNYVQRQNRTEKIDGKDNIPMLFTSRRVDTIQYPQGK